MSPRQLRIVGLLLLIGWLSGSVISMAIAAHQLEHHSPNHEDPLSGLLVATHGHEHAEDTPEHAHQAVSWQFKELRLQQGSKGGHSIPLSEIEPTSSPNLPSRALEEPGLDGLPPPFHHTVCLMLL